MRCKGEFVILHCTYHLAQSVIDILGALLFFSQRGANLSDSTSSAKKSPTCLCFPFTVWLPLTPQTLNVKGSVSMIITEVQKEWISHCRLMLMFQTDHFANFMLIISFKYKTFPNSNEKSVFILLCITPNQGHGGVLRPIPVLIEWPFSGNSNAVHLTHMHIDYGRKQEKPHADRGENMDLGHPSCQLHDMLNCPKYILCVRQMKDCM